MEKRKLVHGHAVLYTSHHIRDTFYRGRQHGLVIQVRAAIIPFSNLGGIGVVHQLDTFINACHDALHVIGILNFGYKIVSGQS